jgi:hypothetical protein
MSKYKRIVIRQCFGKGIIAMTLGEHYIVETTPHSGRARKESPYTYFSDIHESS